MAPCTFIYLFVHLCNRGNLSRASVGVLLLCDSFLYSFAWSFTDGKDSGGMHKAPSPSPVLVARRLSFSVTLLLCTGISSSAPTVSQPVVVHVSSRSKGKLVANSIPSSTAGKGTDRSSLAGSWICEEDP